MESSVSLSQSVKSGRQVKLVCAAKNLLTSLEKCHAMIMAQRNLGIGPFALKQEERDLGKVIEICQRFKSLNFVTSDKDSQFSDVFAAIEQLTTLVESFIATFGPLTSVEGCL